MSGRTCAPVGFTADELAQLAFALDARIRAIEQTRGLGLDADPRLAENEAVCRSLITRMLEASDELARLNPDAVQSGG